MRSGPLGAHCRLRAALGCAPQPAKQEPLDGRHRTRTLAGPPSFRSLVTGEKGDRERRIWELGFCPSLSVGASSDARMIGAIHQIGRLRFAPRRAAAADYSAQWAAELHRAIAANVGHARLLGLWAVELTRLARRRVGPSLGWLWKTWAKS
ncbi:Os02g0282301 [Oryza sativa Japonica Group]|uniref:Os02g0282301 protein n=2 Tax=Oryza sativa subsp. japonica TaxID=39947 RepID=A0A0P0VHP8_ORYSJ|nr:hypothetical protein [Oryza sativa Japonica Group]BAH91628.1 Os02g0282301 [Oryza sativa Japonica Group]BAS78133.1 Os02g0282301 [Oryza sativa Japonica Group]|eukprot:NP_001172899.1 Os02g0282301 [Oryza sativa Japonica Group]